MSGGRFSVSLTEVDNSERILQDGSKRFWLAYSLHYLKKTLFSCTNSEKNNGWQLLRQKKPG